jgi:hypothetical protein
MLHINLAALEGQTFYTALDSSKHIECIGFGQDPTSAANYVVGATWDQASNRTVVRTFLLKDVTFIGKISLTKSP